MTDEGMSCQVIGPDAADSLVAVLRTISCLLCVLPFTPGVVMVGSGAGCLPVVSTNTDRACAPLLPTHGRAGLRAGPPMGVEQPEEAVGSLHHLLLPSEPPETQVELRDSRHAGWPVNHLIISALLVQRSDWHSHG